MHAKADAARDPHAPRARPRRRASCGSPIRGGSVRSTSSTRATRARAPGARRARPRSADRRHRPGRASPRAREGKKATLKAFVLDQSVLAGVGNIYASEALWRAQAPADDARAQADRRRRAAARRRDRRGARATRSTNGGTSLRDFVDADGAEGENADYLWVYGRAGEPCLRCKTTIRRAVLQGRATYYCPTCQTAVSGLRPGPFCGSVRGRRP